MTDHRRIWPRHDLRQRDPVQIWPCRRHWIFKWPTRHDRPFPSVPVRSPDHQTIVGIWFPDGAGIIRPEGITGIWSTIGLITGIWSPDGAGIIRPEGITGIWSTIGLITGIWSPDPIGSTAADLTDEGSRPRHDHRRRIPFRSGPSRCHRHPAGLMQMHCKCYANASTRIPSGNKKGRD